MNAETWLGILGFGGLCGLLGQGARVLIGFKKVNETAGAQQAPAKDFVDLSRLGVSLLIGFIAGALAGTMVFTTWPTIALPQILSVAAAGYAGSDFIEGLMNRVEPSVTAIGSGATTSADGSVG